MGARVQQYCLRWNNHRSNLLTVFDELLHQEAFTDVTLVCDEGVQIKCHKMVLAACSTYFQVLFTELPCSHPFVVLKDVKYDEMKAILDYMYRGEVNVAQDKLASLLKTAENLKVKGLVQEKEFSPNNRYSSAGSCDTGVHNSSNPDEDISAENSPNSLNHSTVPVTAAAHLLDGCDSPPSSYSNARSVSDVGNNSTSASPNMYSNKGHSRISNYNQNNEHLPAQFSNYTGLMSDMPNPKKRKVGSNMTMNRDTPILRTVLGQGQSPNPLDSSQPVSLVCHSNNREGLTKTEDEFKVKIKSEPYQNEPNEDAQSPYTDMYFGDDDDKSRLMIQSPSPQSFLADNRNLGSGIASYIPNQKPEWKRYKQYTRQDINSAIEAVKSGMSALQAARRFGVPSRTLYDKVKKQGIVTSRPFRRTATVNGTQVTGMNQSNSNQGFPYGISGLKDIADNHERSLGMMGSTFLQHGFNNDSVITTFNNKICNSNDINENNTSDEILLPSNTKREESQHVTPNHNSGFSTTESSPPLAAAASLIKFMRQINLTPMPNFKHEPPTDIATKTTDNNIDNSTDQVEDLSMAKNVQTRKSPTTPLLNSTPTSSRPPTPNKSPTTNLTSPSVAAHRVETPTTSLPPQLLYPYSIPGPQPQSCEQTERAVTPVTPQPSPIQQLSPLQQQPPTSGVIISPLQTLKKEICIESKCD